MKIVDNNIMDILRLIDRNWYGGGRLISWKGYRKGKLTRKGKSVVRVLEREANITIKKGYGITLTMQ